MARYDIPLKTVTKRLNLQSTLGLDLGCGDGVFIYNCQRAGGTVVGLDGDSKGLEHAREEIGRRGYACSLVLGNCLSLPFAGDSVDYVVSIELIEHLTSPPVFLAEVARVLKPGGLFVCTTPNRPSSHGFDQVRDPFHIHEFTSEELTGCLENSLKSVKVYGAYPRWLDALYVQGTRYSLVNKTLKLFIKVLSAARNPYVVLVTSNPGDRHDLLVGIGHK